MQVAAYYFPNYHRDERNEAFHGSGWTEWELLKCARPRFAGHRQPRIPLWGYQDEADPAVMAQKIDAASAHGIDAFVFDWYWYDGPYLQRALDEGFLRAPNRDRIKFALMWANHDWHDKHPVSFANATNAPVLYPWTNTPENIGTVWDYIIGRYFTSPSYWFVNGKPYFSIYAVKRFINQMGGTANTAKVLALLRKKAVDAGLPGVHINAVSFDNLDNRPFCESAVILEAEGVGFDSFTSYNSAGATPVWREKFPHVDYAEAAREYLDFAAHLVDGLPVPYYPVVTAGWDSSPRTIQSDTYRYGAYPFMPVMEPEEEPFEKLFSDLKRMIGKYDDENRIIFINAWNEWTEGSYLEPDTCNKYKFLEIIKKQTTGSKNAIPEFKGRDAK